MLKRRDGSQRLFIGHMVTGIGFCDTCREKHGDYLKVAFLDKETGVLDVYEPKSKLMPEIEAHVAAIRAKAAVAPVVAPLTWEPASVGCYWNAADFTIGTRSVAAEESLSGYVLMRNREELGLYPTLAAAQAAAEIAA